MLCDLWIFSGKVYHPEPPHAQSLFLFPIVFGINFYFTGEAFDHPLNAFFNIKVFPQDILWQTIFSNLLTFIFRGNLFTRWSALSQKDYTRGPVVQWSVQRFRSERLRVRSR